MSADVVAIFGDLVAILIGISHYYWRLPDLENRPEGSTHRPAEGELRITHAGGGLGTFTADDTDNHLKVLEDGVKKSSDEIPSLTEKFSISAGNLLSQDERESLNLEDTANPADPLLAAINSEGNAEIPLTLSKILGEYLPTLSYKFKEIQVSHQAESEETVNPLDVKLAIFNTVATWDLDGDDYFKNILTHEFEFGELVLLEVDYRTVDFDHSPEGERERELKITKGDTVVIMDKTPDDYYIGYVEGEPDNVGKISKQCFGRRLMVNRAYTDLQTGISLEEDDIVVVLGDDLDGLDDNYSGYIVRDGFRVSENLNFPTSYVEEIDEPELRYERLNQTCPILLTEVYSQEIQDLLLMILFEQLYSRLSVLTDHYFKKLIADTKGKPEPELDPELDPQQLQQKHKSLTDKFKGYMRTNILEIFQALEELHQHVSGPSARGPVSVPPPALITYGDHEPEPEPEPGTVLETGWYERYIQNPVASPELGNSVDKETTPLEAPSFGTPVVKTDEGI